MHPDCPPCERIEKRLDSLDVHMARNNALLEEHMKRTAALESRLEPIEDAYRGGRAILRVSAWLLGGGSAIVVVVKLLWSKLIG